MTARTSTTLRLGVIGDPVAHSLSPALHQPALDMLGIPATYERWHTPVEEVPARVESLRAPDVLGANVTVPHKLAVMDLVDEVSGSAQRAGAVNTIVNRDGSLYGDNTDIYGFQTALTKALGERSARNVVILGAGGAARAAVLALEAMNASRIFVVNRNQERSGRLMADLAPAPVEIASPDDVWLRAHLPLADVLVNATSLGWKPGEAPLDPRWLDLLPASAVVFDMTYRETDLLRAASERGLRAADGLAMLVHQGARAFTLFTGELAPVEVMLEAARAAQAQTR
ncbi:MAG: shikimate dehydrogenase [Chloroflexota bacterium]|nr:shikimate dehydrogenase [Chloroflexota bacterium]